AFLAHEIAQALELADQVLDLRHRRHGDPLHDGIGVPGDIVRRGLGRAGAVYRVPPGKFLHRSFAPLDIDGRLRRLHRLTTAPSRRNIDHDITPLTMAPTPQLALSSAATTATLWPRRKRKRRQSVNFTRGRCEGAPLRPTAAITKRGST